jgi:hypothetical protein
MALQGFYMQAFLSTLAQMSIDSKLLEGRPPLNADSGASGMTWIIAALLVVGILLITFKTSKRNHLERG